MKKILLLGGNGYVGCSLYDHLTGAGYQVTNVDLCWFGKIYEETVCEDYRHLTKEFIHSFTHIILLAGHSSVSMCGNDLMSCFRNNVVNFVDLVEKLDEKQTLLYASTAAVYGNNNNLVDESYPLAGGISYYDHTKICGDNIAGLFPKKKIVGLRFGSVSGFSKNFRSENLLNAVTMSAIKDHKITVTNPQNYRSVLGMKDLCRVFTTLLESESINNRIYNVTSVNTRILDFAEQIRSFSNCELIINGASTTNFSFNCDNSLFQKEFDFRFQDTVESMYYDIVNNQDLIVSDLKRTPMRYHD